MVKTTELSYVDGNITCRAFIAYPNTNTPAPGILVSHDWTGRSHFACDKAMELAELGYVGFALDMYGDAKLGRDNSEKIALITPFKTDRALLIQRIQSAYQTLITLPEVNRKKIGAIGFCFGGMCVLDLARSGVAIAGVVSFHGALDAPTHLSHEHLNTKVLACHGYDDPLVPPTEIDKFAVEMTARGVDWQLHAYGLVQHAFTNPEANDDSLGLHYHAKADSRSFASMRLFFQEVFEA